MELCKKHCILQPSGDSKCNRIPSEEHALAGKTLMLTPSITSLQLLESLSIGRSNGVGMKVGAYFHTLWTNFPYMDVAKLIAALFKIFFCKYKIIKLKASSHCGFVFS